jgi:nucleotide-binding universal stress UspA family protein
MSIAKILVPMSGAPGDTVAINAALVAAGPFAAHVQALFVPADPRLSIPYVGTPVSPSVIDSIMKSLEELNQQASVRARQALNTAAKVQDVRVTDSPKKLDGVSCSFREAAGVFALRTGRYARLSDLVVFASLPNDTFSEANEAFVETLLRTERPVLIAPQAPATLTSKVSVAWDGGIPCAHAMTAALPFLKHAGQVELLEVEPIAGNGLTVTEAQEYLSLHGVPTSMRFVKREKHTTAEVLLHEAAAGGASLLVMGGYGHNRFAETIFGGVTKHIKWHATLPVLMSH